MTKLMKDVFELPLKSVDYQNQIQDANGVEVSFIDFLEYEKKAICDAVNNHDTLTEQNKQLVGMLSRVNDNYQKNLTKRNGGEPVDFGADGEVNKVWVEVPLLKEIESFLAKHKEQV